MKQKICSALKYCGVPAQVLGYKYLEYAIECVIENESIIHHVTKHLYPAVAEYFDTTCSRVERSIRHAIELAFDIMPTEVQSEIFGNTVDFRRGKATNAQFIATLTEYVTSRSDS